MPDGSGLHGSHAHRSDGDSLDLLERSQRYRSMDQLGRHALRFWSYRTSSGSHLAKQPSRSGWIHLDSVVLCHLRIHILHLLWICCRGSKTLLQRIQQTSPCMSSQKSSSLHQRKIWVCERLFIASWVPLLTTTR